jgi:hypothetical protein
MKTLAQLKRDLSVGTKVTLINSETMPEHKFLNLERYVIKTQGNGITLGLKPDDKKGSFMEYPKATGLEYIDDTFTLYTAGERPLTQEEKDILNNMPSKRPENKEKLEIEIMTDGNGLYWQDRAYFKDLDMQYLEGYEKIRGLRRSQEVIQDDTIKGKIDLQYKIN